MLVARQNRNEILLLQDLYFGKKRAPVITSVKEAVCVICDKGLDDGLSITARTIRQRTRFFCQYHLPKDL